MILFNEKEWSILVPPGESIFARQYDHLSREIVVEGTPSDWQFYMLVETSGHHDTILLSPVQNGIGVTLTREMLSFSGAYYIQLKGVKDEIERHTNVVQTYIPSSLSGEADWPDIPSEFEQIEQRIHELNTHPPYPGDGGFWMVWDVDRNEYFQSELPLPPIAEGPAGEAATIRIEETITGESGTEAKVENLGNENAAVLRFTIPMGEPGPTGKTPDISVEVSSLSSDSEPTVNVTGTPEKPVITIGIPRGRDGDKGDPGAKGDPGSPGQTPNIKIGTVETLPEGSEVTASITGETPNLVLNLGIPKGDKGDTGNGVPPIEGIPTNYVLTPAGWTEPSYGKSGGILLASYIHQGNPEYHIESFDYGTAVAQCTEPHGLTEPARVMVVPNGWYDLPFGSYVKYVPAEWVTYNGDIYIVPLTETTFLVAQKDKETPLTADIDNPYNVDMDATKLHFEAPINWEINGLDSKIKTARIALNISGFVMPGKYRYIQVNTKPGSTRYVGITNTIKVEDSYHMIYHSLSLNIDTAIQGSGTYAGSAVMRNRRPNFTSGFAGYLVEQYAGNMEVSKTDTDKYIYQVCNYPSYAIYSNGTAIRIYATGVIE